MKKIFAISFPFLFITFPCFATTYYVDATNGNDNNNGLSESLPWKTISKVESSAGMGDSVLFKRGETWNDKLDVPASNMVFKDYGLGNLPIIDGNGFNIAINTNRKNDITIQNLYLTKGSGPTVFVYGGVNITIKNNTIIEGDFCIQAWPSSKYNTPNLDNLIISDNTLSGGNNDAVIGISKEGTSTISNITITRNKITATPTIVSEGITLAHGSSGLFDISENEINDVGSYGIMAWNCSGGNWKISGNKITKWSQSANDRGGIHIVDVTGGIWLVEKNSLSDGGGDWRSAPYYIDTISNSSIILKNNQAENSMGSGIRIHRADNVKIYGNLIKNCGKD